MQPIHIFRAGRHTAASGTTLDFSEDALREAAAAYDPAKHEAPIVVGHPKDNAPAFGWVAGLEFAEGNLTATPAQIDENFAEAVKAGRYKKVSASFYTPSAPGNPVPGVYYLRHVGFLGAQPPAIKGLRAVNFAEAEDGVVEFSDFEIAGFLRRFREWFIDKFSREEADTVVPDHLVQAIEDAARREAVSEAEDAGAAPSFSEPESTTMTEAEIQALTQRATEAEAALEALRAREAEFAERADRLAKAEAAARRAETERAVDALVQQGKVLPAERDGLVAYLEAVPTETVVEFGEGDAASSKPAREFLLAMLGARPAQVQFNEFGAPDGSPKPDGMATEDIAKRAADFREAEAKAGREISVTTAVQAVLAGAA